MKIEVFFFRGCPHAAPALALVRRGLERAGIAAEIREIEGDYPSPTVRINGVDVMGEQPLSGRSCRLDVPSEATFLHALSRAFGGAT